MSLGTKIDTVSVLAGERLRANLRYQLIDEARKATAEFNSKLLDKIEDSLKGIKVEVIGNELIIRAEI